MKPTAAKNKIVPASAFREKQIEKYISFIDRGEKTTKTYITNLRQFVAWLRYTGTTQPARDDIIQFREWLLNLHKAIKLDPEAPNGWNFRTDKEGNPVEIICKPNTAKEYLQSVRQFFKWASAAGLYPNIAENVHVPKLQQDTHKKDSFSPSEVRTIEQSILRNDLKQTPEQNKRLYAIFVLAVNCGLRTIEISRANIKDLETRNGITYLYIWGKGHTEADTKKPIAPEVKEAIDEYLRMRTDSLMSFRPLFVSTGNRSGGQRIAPSTISTMLKRAFVAAGYNSERLTAHSLRHTAGTNVLTLTDNLYLTQQYLRHKTPATTEIYLHNETALKEYETACKLYALYHGRAPDQDERSRLEELEDEMTPAQIEKLLKMAEMIFK